jgi:hypothetical protein
MSFNSRSRPTKGGSRPADLSEPPTPETTRSALQVEVAGRLVDNRLLAHAACPLADEHRPRVGGRLDPRRGVDDVTGHHPLALRADRHRRLTGHHAGTGSETFVEVGDRRD